MSNDSVTMNEVKLKWQFSPIKMLSYILNFKIMIIGQVNYEMRLIRTNVCVSFTDESLPHSSCKPPGNNASEKSLLWIRSEFIWSYHKRCTWGNQECQEFFFNTACLWVKTGCWVWTGRDKKEKKPYLPDIVIVEQLNHDCTSIDWTQIHATWQVTKECLFVHRRALTS